MLKNNNQAVIRKMAVRSIRSNRKKNSLYLVAIVLAVLMLFTVMQTGASYMHMQYVWRLHSVGELYDGILMGGVTKEQEETVKADPGIEVVGITEFMLGNIGEKNISIIYEDKNYREKMHQPGILHQEGRYPETADEVMVTKTLLEKRKLENLTIGDTLLLSYQKKDGTQVEKPMKITGIIDDYEETANCFVTEEVFEQAGYSQADYGCGILYYQYRFWFASDRIENRLKEELNLERKQNIQTTWDCDKVKGIFLGMIGIIMLTCLSAYLLIYNIVYLSIEDNIRYYGLLRAVGMTESQMHRLLWQKQIILSGIGILMGIVLGFLTSYLVIPGTIRVLGLRSEKMAVTIKPEFLMLTIAIMAVTVYIASRKPVRVAERISVMEALGYQTSKVVYTGKKKRTGKNIIYRLAWQQLCRMKKKTILVILSLSTSLTVFLCVVTLAGSQSKRTAELQYMDADMELTNKSMVADTSDWKQPFDDTFCDKLSKIDGVKEIHKLDYSTIVVPWEPDFSDQWMRDFYDQWMYIKYDDVREEYQQNPEDFMALVVGIDEKTFHYINQQNETAIDEKSFLEGESCLLCQQYMGYTNADVKNKKISFYFPGQETKKYSTSVAGLQKDDSPYRGPSEVSLSVAGIQEDDSPYLGPTAMGPTIMILVSDSFLEDKAESLWTYKVSVIYDEEYDKETEKKVKELIQESKDAKDITWSSKLKGIKEQKPAEQKMWQLGMGIAIVLGFIGVMNYINTELGSISGRRREIAILESIGMTGKQQRRLLLTEGMYYAGISLFLTATVGLGIDVLLFQRMNYHKVAFSIPVIPVVVMIVTLFALCIFVPLAAGRFMEGDGTLVERIRHVGE